AAGRVTLNGRRLSSPAMDVRPGDEIRVDGVPLPVADRTRLWLNNKPRGLVTTNRDPAGPPTVIEKLPPELPPVVPGGRLDVNTAGLRLRTTAGGLARVLELPATGWLRRYRVRAHGTVTEADLAAVKDGVTVDGVRYGLVQAALDRVQGDNAW